MMTKIAQPFSEAVGEKLIRLLQEGTAPWQKARQPGEPGTLLPMNPTTGKRYQGINAIQLMSQGHADPRWLTFPGFLQQMLFYDRYRWSAIKSCQPGSNKFTCRKFKNGLASRKNELLS